MDNAILSLCTFVVRAGWEEREDEGDYPRSLAQKALAEADALRANLDKAHTEVAAHLRARDDEIVRLRAALAAGPAALREIIGEPDTNDRDVYEHACGEVEAAQERAMKGGG